MFECVILGDSLAVGVAQVARECHAIAKVGITSQAFVSQHRVIPAGGKVLISLGSNDVGQTFVHVYGTLRELRQRAGAAKVVWLMSANNVTAASAVERLAREFGDTTIHVRPYVGADGVHPNITGYQALARQFLNSGQP